VVCIISSQLVCVFHASEDRQSSRFTAGAEHAACFPLGNDRRCTMTQQPSLQLLLPFSLSASQILEASIRNWLCHAFPCLSPSFSRTVFLSNVLHPYNLSSNPPFLLLVLSTV
jgi:hypothetical protein